MPHTKFSITEEGASALKKYWEGLDAIRAMQDQGDNSA
jgi:hypothetical protein